MVAITVMLAALVGSFAFGLWNNTSDVPRADFSFEWDLGANEMTITHETGQSIDADEVVIVSNDVDIRDQGGTEVAYGSSHSWADLVGGGIDQVEIGDSVTIEADGDFDGKEVLVVWRNDDRSDELATWQESN